MDRKTSIIALSAGILFGFLAFFLLHQRSSEIERRTTPVQILIASRYLPPGSTLTSDAVVTKQVPEGYVDPGAIQSLNNVEGLVTLVPISAGEQVLSNKFGTGDGSLSFLLEKGHRAYTLEINETSSVGHLLRPGDHVDIIGRISIDKRELTGFILQDVPVIATGQRTIGRKAMSSEGDPTESYNTVTLSMIPEQCETLMHLENQRLRLLLRPPTDHELVTIAPRSENEIISRFGHGTSHSRRGITSVGTEDELP